MTWRYRHPCAVASTRRMDAEQCAAALYVHAALRPCPGTRMAHVRVRAQAAQARPACPPKEYSLVPPWIAARPAVKEAGTADRWKVRVDDTHGTDPVPLRAGSGFSAAWCTCLHQPIPRRHACMYGSRSAAHKATAELVMNPFTHQMYTVTLSEMGSSKASRTQGLASPVLAHRADGAVPILPAHHIMHPITCRSKTYT